MLKIKIIKYMTLYELIKKIAKGKLSNLNEFIYNGKVYTTDTIFKDFHCNNAMLNEKIELKELKEKYK